MEDVLGGPLPDIGVTRDRDLHRSGPERVVLGALDLLPLDALTLASRRIILISSDLLTRRPLVRG